MLTQLLNANKSVVDNRKKRDEINEIYEFNIKFDGTPGEPALEFRDAVVNHDRFVFTHIPKEYSELRIVIRVLKNLTGDAALQYNKRSGPKFSKLDEFLIWFDKTFKLHTLRQELFQQLRDWTIDSDTPDLSIITKYRQKLQLFYQTNAVSTQDVIDSTPLTDVLQVASINRAIEKSKPELYDFIDNYMKDFNRAAAPMNIDILEAVIERGVKYLQTKRINSNRNILDPTKLGSVNAVSLAQFPNLNNTYNNSYNNNYNNNSNNNSNNNYNNYNKYNNQSNWNGNLENNNDKFDNNNDNNVNNYNPSWYRNNRSNTRGRGRGRGSRYRGRGRGRGRGRRGGYRSRGRYRNNSSYSNKPNYNDGYCTKCRFWGHYRNQCNWIHTKRMATIMKQFSDRVPDGLPKELPSSVNMTHQTNKNDKDNDNDNKDEFDNFYDH